MAPISASFSGITVTEDKVYVTVQFTVEDEDEYDTISKVDVSVGGSGNGYGPTILENANYTLSEAVPIDVATQNVDFLIPITVTVEYFGDSNGDVLDSLTITATPQELYGGASNTPSNSSSSTSSSASVRPHEPDPNGATPDSRVYVNGTRIPASDADIHIRNEGPIDMGYYGEVYFPSPWNGEDYLDLFTSIEGTDGTGLDELYVEVASHDSDSYFPAFRGVVTGVGNAGTMADGETTAPERMWKMRAQGPAFFLAKTPVGENFEQTGTQLIFDAVGEQIGAKLPFSVTTPNVQGFDTPEQDDVGTEDGEGDQFSDSGGLVSGVEGATDEDVVGGSTPNVTKTFQKNKHTLADVLSWLSRQTNALLYFQPRPNGVRLQPYFGGQIQEHDAHYLGGDIDVIANDALSEINPINTAVVNSKAAETLGKVGPHKLNVSSGKYVQATARHIPLYERAGETELVTNTFTESGSTTAEETKNEAVKILRERIAGATAGDMTVRLHHPITPYDTITARSTCRTSSATDTTPITYNVSRVHHKIRASGMSKTKLHAGVAVSEDDIEVSVSYKET